MQDLGPWITATKDHVAQHWQRHLVPLLVFMGAGMAVGFVATFFFMCAGFGSSIIGAISNSSEIMAAAIILGFGLAMLVLVLAMFAIMPLYMGYLRQILMVHRGQEPTRADLLWGYHNLGRVALLFLIQAVLGTMAACCCYLPAFLVWTAFFFAFPIMVDRELGAIESLKASWAMVKPRFLAILLALVLYMCVSMVAAYIPIVGPFLTMVAFVGFTVVAYDDIVTRGRFFETWRG